MAQWDLWFDYFFLFSIPTTVLYCFVLYVIIKSKQKRLKSTYFKIYVATGLSTLLCKLYILQGIFDVQLCLAIQYILIATNIGAGPSQEPISRVALFMTGPHYSTHFFGNFAMACYQFTMVYSSHRAQRFWTNRTLCIFSLLAVFYSAAVYVPLLFVRLIYNEQSPDFYVWTGYDDDQPITRAYTVDAVTSSTCQILSTLCIVLSAVKIALDRRKAMLFASSQSYSASTEQRHLVFTALNTILIGLVVGYDVAGILGELNSENAIIAFFAENMIKVIFVLMVVNGPMMLVTSKQVRNEIFRVVRPEAKTSTTLFSVTRL